MIENQQKPLPADQRADGIVRIHSIFATIQGEGPFCGERALFIRLFGCNLQCPGCDTEYTLRNEVVAPNFMLYEARRLGWPKGALVVITGGEPFRQNIVPSVLKLLDAGYQVQIETNGILWLEDLPVTHKRFSIVCSPKTSKIHKNIRQWAKAFKYVVQADDISAVDGLPNHALLHKAAPEVTRPPAGALVYIQPMDEGEPAANARNLQAAICSTMRHGYRLQIQIHKLINME